MQYNITMQINYQISRLLDVGHHRISMLDHGSGIIRSKLPKRTHCRNGYSGVSARSFRFYYICPPQSSERQGALETLSKSIATERKRQRFRQFYRPHQRNGGTATSPWRDIADANGIEDLKKWLC